MTISNIIDKFENEDHKALIKNAYDFAKYRLEGKYHFSGKPLLDYWLDVVNELFRFNVDYIIVMSAILYETINYGTDLREIEFIFGEDIRDIIYKLKRINDSEFYFDDARLMELYANMDRNNPCDFKTLFIKLGERFHHLKLIRECSDNNYKRMVADDTTEVLSPIAHKMGLTYLKSQLDDICLECIEPDIYYYILNELTKTPEEVKKDVIHMKDDLASLLRENKIDVDFKWRVKNIMGIYKKLLRGKEFSDIYDIRGITIITSDIYDCYRIFDIIASKYRVIPSEFKDYIAFPKENNYSALHVCVCNDNNEKYEIQIKTKNMYKEAVASHYAYKLKKYEH